MATATIAAAGGDYTTLTSWAAALPAVLAEPEIAEIDGWLGAIGTQTLAVTTSEVNKLVIRAKAGQETDYSTTSAKAGFENSTGFDHAFNLGAGCGHLDIEKIGAKIASNGNLFTSSSASGLGANPQVSLTDCWYFGLESPFFLMQGGEIGRPIDFVNCLGLNVRGHGLSTGDTPPTFTNCTHVFSIVFADNSGSAGFRYCVTNKCFAAHYGPTSGWGCFLNRKAGSGNDAATDATADLLDNLVLADQYVDPANDDWTLKPTAALKGGAAGADIGFVMPSGGVAAAAELGAAVQAHMGGLLPAAAHGLAALQPANQNDDGSALAAAAGSIAAIAGALQAQAASTMIANAASSASIAAAAQTDSGGLLAAVAASFVDLLAAAQAQSGSAMSGSAASAATLLPAAEAQTGGALDAIGAGMLQLLAAIQAQDGGRLDAAAHAAIALLAAAQLQDAASLSGAAANAASLSAGRQDQTGALLSAVAASLAAIAAADQAQSGSALEAAGAASIDIAEALQGQRGAALFAALRSIMEAALPESRSVAADYEGRTVSAPARPRVVQR